MIRREIHISPLLDPFGQNYARLLVDYGDRDPYALANETADLWKAHGWEVFGRPTWMFTDAGPSFAVLSRDIWSEYRCCQEPTPGEPVALSILLGEA